MAELTGTGGKMDRVELDAAVAGSHIEKARCASLQHDGLSPSSYKGLDIVVEGELNGDRAQTHFVSL